MKIWLFFLLALHVSLYGNFLTSEELHYLREKKEITLCVDPDWLPIEKIENGKHIGINAEYFKHLSALIHTPFTLVPTKSWNHSLALMKDKSCDILSFAIETPSRKEYLNFTQPTFNYALAIATTMEKAFIDTIDSIADKKLAIVKGYAFIEVLRAKYPKINFEEVNNLKEGFDLVRKKEVFGYIDILPVLSYAIQNNHFESLKINGKFDDIWRYSIGVQKDLPTLFTIIDKTIAQVDIQTKIGFQNQWIKVKYEDKPDYQLFIHLFLASVLVILFFLYRLWIIGKYHKKLCDSVKSFEILFSSTIEGIIVFDKTMHCIMANQAASDIFGYTQEEFIGKHYSKLIAKEELSKVKKGFKYSSLSPHEALSMKKDGTSFIAWTKGINTIWNEQKVRISCIIDITEYKNLHTNLEKLVASQVEEIEEKNQLIQQQNKLISMGEMIGAIAHQWRQPLNALNINIQNLEDDFEEGLVDKVFIDEFITRNKKTIDFMSHTIDDFRNFFRIDKEKQKFWVLEAIHETLSLQSALLENHHIHVSIKGENIKINSFKSEFKQAILNIISNAKDAILSHKTTQGKIDITLVGKSIIIEDNGGGIKQSILDRIFEPYFTTKEQGKGTGLGLYIAKMIIEKNIKGSLKAENTKYGAKFSITLPTKAIQIKH